jgi:predicted O-methyltransferase YrrM
MSITAAPAIAEPLNVIDELYRDFPVARTAGGTPYVNIADEYVAWLSFANAGMLNKGNLLALDYATRNLPSTNPIIEIGAFCGLSTNLIGYYLKKHGASNTLFNCDAWQFEGAGGPVGDSDLHHDEYRDFVRASYKYNVRTFSRGRMPHTIELLSDDFFAAWAKRETRRDVFGRSATLGGPISFAFIDGNHSYDFAKKDFENVDRFLEPGGFILFDDSADGSHWEVTRVIAEIKERSDYRVVVKNPNYLVQKVR